MTVRVVLHVAYPSAAARRRLLTVHLPRLGDGRWYVVDVPVSVAGVPTPGLEVAIIEPPEPPMLQAWLAEGLHSGDITAVQAAPGSAVLEPGLHPGGVVPAPFIEALAVTSSRAGALLSALDIDVPAPEQVVADEFCVLYDALVPRRERARAQRWHAAWLEGIAGEAPPASPATEDIANIKPVTGSLPEFRGIGWRLARHAVRVARASGGALDAAEIRTAIVARLAHIHAVRLWGPAQPDALWREARLLRRLAALRDEGN